MRLGQIATGGLGLWSFKFVAHGKRIAESGCQNRSGVEINIGEGRKNGLTGELIYFQVTRMHGTLPAA